MPSNLQETINALTLAVAPVFMITGIGSVIASMNTRYGRVIDRIRTLLREGNCLYNMKADSAYVGVEILSLYNRARLLRLAIMLMAGSVFFVALTVFIIFGEMIYREMIPFLIETSFLSSLLCLILGMACFIRDFAISLKMIKKDIEVRVNPRILEFMRQEQRSENIDESPSEKTSTGID